MDESDAHDPERLLLRQVLTVEHPYMDDHLGRRTSGLMLESDAEPSMAFLAVLKALRRDGVSKHEKSRRGPSLAGQPFHQKPVLVIEHLLKPIPADVAVARSVDGGAHGHVVSRHGLGDGP